MELIRGLHNLRDRHRRCVLSIGNFDGFHRGHQALIERLQYQARRCGARAAVQIFEPTPREFFSPKDAPGRVATFRDKLLQLAAAGVERVLCVRFGRSFASIPAQQYVEQVLVGKLGVKAVVVGDDFRFGAGRGGDFALLQRLGQAHGFAADALGAVMVDGERASSTALRSALAAPDLERATRLLGRPYALSGRVRRGLQLGRKLAMPTANIALKRRPALRFGVYVVQAELQGRPSPILSPHERGEGGRRGLRSPELEQTRWMGVANVGVRPTLDRSECLLETHLFGAPGDLYGKVMQVRFLKFLREERRFDSLELLAGQMQQDAKDAREWLKQFSSV